MKRGLFGLAIVGIFAVYVVGAIAFCGIAIVLAHKSAAGSSSQSHHHGFAIEQLPRALNMSSDQQTKIQPIIDQVQPEIIAIRKQAKERIHRAIDRSVSQIRPLLTADQQARLDKVEKARQDLLTAVEKLRVALNQ